MGDIRDLFAERMEKCWWYLAVAYSFINKSSDPFLMTLKK